MADLPEDPAHHLDDAAGVAVDHEGVAADADPLEPGRRIGQAVVEEVVQPVVLGVPAARQEVAEPPGPRIVAVGRAVGAEAIALLAPVDRRVASPLPALMVAVAAVAVVSVVGAGATPGRVDARAAALTPAARARPPADRL